MIASNKVVIFSWVQCPYCVKAKQLFASLSKEVTAYEIDKMPEGGAIKTEIEKKFKHDTVPAVFIKGQFIGGFSDCDALHKQGKLVPMLADTVLPVVANTSAVTTPTTAVIGDNARATGMNRRASGTNARATGTNPRASGTNARATRTNRRVSGTNARSEKKKAAKKDRVKKPKAKK